ncbi:MAG TPA: DUF5685 family protein [Pseudobacteroides sp.]|nr:DUF5685 family protein [Pseudobacteroides sp.]
MFGYVRYSKPDLTFRDYYKYKAYYCGMCFSIKNNFGQLKRLSLNYDIVFMAILFSGIYGGCDKVHLKKCFLSPFKKKKVILNEYLDYCSSINVLFSYYKLLDDYKDNKSVHSLLLSKILYKDYIKIKDKYPYKEKIVRDGFEKIQELEKFDKTTLDEISDVFGEILGEMFVYNPQYDQLRLLREIGFYLGKLVYYLDSIDDIEDDAKRKRFNPLLNSYEHNIEKKIDDMIKRIEDYTMQLDIKHSKEIILNIVSQGLRNKSGAILAKVKGERKTDDN